MRSRIPFNALLGFVFMFAIAFMLISNPIKQGTIDSHAEMLVTIRWPDDHPDDVDAIVEDPMGEIVWYYNRDSDLCTLIATIAAYLQTKSALMDNSLPMPLTKRPSRCEAPLPASMW